MEKDKQLIYDALVERAQDHADRVLPEIIEMYRSAPWNEFRDALADIFIAGAEEALTVRIHGKDGNSETQM